MDAQTEDATIHLIDNRSSIAPSKNPPKSKKTPKSKTFENFIYGTYAGCDGLFIAYSIFKYYFDLNYSKDLSAKEMHDWMVSSPGFWSTSIGTIALMALSYTGCVEPDNDKNKVTSPPVSAELGYEQVQVKIRNSMAWIWPYIRDSFKGIKFSYKGILSTKKALDTYGYDFPDLLNRGIPLFVGMGALNRVVYRYTVMEQRKKYQRLNKDFVFGMSSIYQCNKFLNEANPLRVLVKQSSELKPFELFQSLRKEIEAEIKEQQNKLGLKYHRLVYASSIYSGLVDGVYTYMGPFSQLSKQLKNIDLYYLNVITYSCLIYTAACIINRCYEEFEYQQELLDSQLRIQLQALENEMSSWLQHLELDESKIKNFETKFSEGITELVNKRKQIDQLQVFSLSRSILWGLRIGLFSYSAISSVVGAASLAITTLPPLVVISGALLGGGACVLAIGYSVWQWYIFVPKNEIKSEIKIKEFMDFFNQLALKKSDKYVSLLTSKLKTEICSPSSAPVYKFFGRSEVCRSFFSGISKGQKAVNYSCNSSLQFDEEQGEYLPTDIMRIFGVLTASLYAFSYSVRAYLRIPAEPDPVNDEACAAEGNDDVFNLPNGITLGKVVESTPSDASADVVNNNIVISGALETSIPTARSKNTVTVITPSSSPHPNNEFMIGHIENESNALLDSNQNTNQDDDYVLEESIEPGTPKAEEVQDEHRLVLKSKFSNSFFDVASPSAVSRDNSPPSLTRQLSTSGQSFKSNMFSNVPSIQSLNSNTP